MGFLTRLFTSPQAAAFVMTDPRVAVRSPWSSTALHKIALDELIGLKPTEVTRSDAMRIPAIVRGRGLICGTLSRYPLALFQSAGTGNPDDDVQMPTPAWMTSTETGQSPITRMLWTLDDLIFNAMSVWATKRDPETKAIIDAVRVPPEYWHVDPDTLGVQVNGEPAQADQVIIIEGPQDRLLDIASDAVEGSRNLAGAWQQRVKAPVPLVAITQTEPNVELDEVEIDDLILDYEAARRQSGTAFVPYGFKAEAMGTVAPDLYVEARNAERLDWGNYLGLPAAMLDGSMSTATLTYSTQEGKRAEFVDYSLFYWAAAIEARLSLDDVTQPGTYARFDLSWLTTATQQTRNAPSED